MPPVNGKGFRQMSRAQCKAAQQRVKGGAGR